MGTRRVAKKKTPKKRNKTAPKKATQTKVDTPTPTTQNKATSKYAPTYELFTEFMALPTGVRESVFKNPKTGEPIDSQKDFAEAYNIDQALLSRYKLTDDYVDKVSRIRKRYFKGEIGDAIQAVLINVIQNGKGADLKVLLDYANEIDRDDPLGETSQVYAELLAKVSKMIPD